VERRAESFGQFEGRRPKRQVSCYVLLPTLVPNLCSAHGLGIAANLYLLIIFEAKLMKKRSELLLVLKITSANCPRTSNVERALQKS
jgi:hypothetical protein